MKAIEQYFHVALFIMLYKVVLSFDSADEILVSTIQMKAVEQYFQVVLLLMLCRVDLTVKSLNGIPEYDYSRDNFQAVPLTRSVCLSKC